MADYENNYKYIAEAWINNGEEEAYKTAFMTSLLKQWQHHGHGFCADKLDGYHAEHFINRIDEVEENSLHTFWIGATRFDNSTNKYNIDISSINLYPYINVSDEDLTNALKIMPWERDGITHLDDGPFNDSNPSLVDILTELYLDLDDKKVDQEEYDAFVDTQNGINSQYENLLSINQWLTPDGINASTVNGLRFYVKTPEQYEQVPLETKKNIHNIFIIKDPEDFPEGMTEYDGNPDIAQLDKGYEFKVDMATTTDELGNTVTEPWLMYRLGEGEWKLIAKASDFIDPNSIEEVLRRVLGQNTWVLNSEVLYNALKSMTNAQGSDDEIPMLAHVKEKYVYGGLFSAYSYTNPTSSKPYGEIKKTTTKIELPTETKNGYKYINISDVLSDATNGYATAMNQQLSTIEGAITQNKSDISRNYSLIGGHTTDINKHEQAIYGTQNDSTTGLNWKVDDIYEKIRNIVGQDEFESNLLRKISFDYLKPYMMWMDGISRLSTDELGAQRYRSFILYYPFLSLAYLYISFEHKYIATTDRYRWVDLRSGMSNTKFSQSKYPTLYKSSGTVGNIFDWYDSKGKNSAPWVRDNPNGPYIPKFLWPMTTVTRSNSDNYRSSNKKALMNPDKKQTVKDNYRYPEATPIIKYNTNGKIQVMFTGQFDTTLYLYGGTYYLIKPQGDFDDKLPQGYNLASPIEQANPDLNDKYKKYFRSLDTILNGED